MDSILDRARRMRIRLANQIGPEKLVWLKNKLSTSWKRLKGSKRDPFLYLGGMAIILFGLISSLGTASNVSFFTTEEPSRGGVGSFVFPEIKVKESPDLSLIQKNSLAAISPPIMVTPQVLGALAGGTDYQEVQKAVTEYIVQPGDNLSSIAVRFNISLETLLWANGLSKNSLLHIGQKLVILPVSGVIHHIKKGDTVSGIAQTYKAKADEIIAFNDLSGEGDIFIGDILIIPDGVMPPLVVYAPPSVPLASSYFICPALGGCRITQGLHWYNAVDFSNGKCGEMILAAAGGVVQKMRFGWNGGAGNYLTVLHPSGVVTLYGHLQTIFVSPGQGVFQGQMIATMGGQPGTPGAGKSTGCHLHFSVTGARNPFAQ